MSKIHILNEYDALKTVILGTADQLYFPGTHSIEMEAESSWWKKLLNKLIYANLERRKVPQFIVKKYQEELSNLEIVLKSQGIEVLRLEEVFPSKDESAGLGQMFARDAVMCVDDQMIAGKLQIEMRQKELRGFDKILKKYARIGKVASIDPTGDGQAYLEGGDVMVDYPYVYVGIGKYASNLAGAKWLQELVGDKFQVVPVKLANEGILHLDCCMTIIGEKMGIIHRDSLQNPLPEPLRNYDFIEVDEKTRHEMGTNVLLLGRKKIVVQKRHEALRQALSERGFEVFPINYTWHAMLDGAFRCTTCPIDREAE